jgi:hypothetical protein
MAKKAHSHRDLEVYQRAFDGAMAVFELSKAFPREEKFALLDQIRRSSRSVAPTWPRPGGNGGMRLPSLTN